MFLWNEKIQNSGKLQNISGKFQNSGKFQDNVINDVKQNSSNCLVKSDKFLRLGPRSHEELYGSCSKYLLSFFISSPTVYKKIQKRIGV